MALLPDAQTFPIMEEESGRFTALLVGDDGVTPLPGSTLTTLRLTLYVILQDGTDQIVNERDQQNVLNQNGVSVLETPLTAPDGSRYNLIWNIQAADTTIVDDRLKYESHIALWEWTAPTSTSGKAEAILRVKNLRRVG